MNIFIIGKIGSGKSTVAEMFSSFQDTLLIDADRIAREVLRMPEVQKDLLETFGELIMENDEIVPESLAEKAFADRESVEKLNAIMHPEILERIRATIDETRKNIIDIPLPGIGRDVIRPDVTIRVDCPDGIIKERCDQPEKLERQRFIDLPEKADYVIDNGEGMESTQEQVDRIWEQYEHRCLPGKF
ncbi:MAG: dephospho-CoA kinase [DPANN group archaeon]|nr:dephospho-CoA kinase [DPANN group archaeon]